LNELAASVFSTLGSGTAQLSKLLERAEVDAGALPLRFRAEGVVERRDLDNVRPLGRTMSNSCNTRE
jgi:hypothetical protein